MAKRKIRPKELPGCSFHYLLIANPRQLMSSRTPWVFISLPTNCKSPPTYVQYEKNTVGKEKQKKQEEKFAKVEILPSACSRNSESDF